MTPTSANISVQIAGVDASVASLQDHAEALSLEAVSGNRAAADELARVKSEVAGLLADREVLVSARKRAIVLENDAAEDAKIEDRRAHLLEARNHAAAALMAAQAMDNAIAAFVAASTDLNAAEQATRQHLRLAGENPDGHIGRHGAAAHGTFLLSRIADGTAKRRHDRTVSELVSSAWAEYLEEDKARG